MPYDFTGKFVLVTGSSSGIGRDLVINFAKHGAKVTVTGRNVERIKSVSDECSKVSTATGVKVLSIVADVTKDADVQRLVDETVKTFGQLDILVNCAGFGALSHIQDDNFMEVFDSVLNTNLKGYLRVIKQAVPHLLKSKGANIINVSSIDSTTPSGYAMAYCTSKAAVDMITKCLCNDLSPKGIRVNAINPAMIETPFHEHMGMDPKAIEEARKREAASYPIRRIGHVSDTTAACLYLASDDASFITGINHKVDGGMQNV